MTYFVQTDVTLKWQQNPGYNDMLSKFVPYMATRGWQLRYGLQPLVGDLRELTHIWEIPSLESLTVIEPKGLANDVALREILAPMADLVHNEKIRLLVKTPYSP